MQDEHNFINCQKSKMSHKASSYMLYNIYSKKHLGAWQALSNFGTCKNTSKPNFILGMIQVQRRVYNLKVKSK